MHVPVSRPLLGEEETKTALDALQRGEISGFSGTYIQTFEQKFAEFCGSPYAVAVSNGTVALHLALVTLGIGAGDEVIVSSFTNMATFFAVKYQGARPIPIDSEPRTLNIDPSLIEARITEKTRAIIVVHIYGHPVDMDPILEIARKHNLFVIEDAAEAHGATYKGKPVGSLGDIGCFSFYANKIITTGEGGMLTCQKEEHAARARMLKSLAFGTQNKFMHQDVGYNYRLTNLQAAIGVAQMSKVEEILSRKRAMGAFYLEALKDIDGLALPVEESYAKSVYWMFNVVLHGKLEGKRSEFMRLLKERGVETREDFIPYNMQDIFLADGDMDRQSCPVANRAAENGFYIPSGTLISAEELSYVSDAMHEVAAELSGE